MSSMERRVVGLGRELAAPLWRMSPLSRRRLLRVLAATGAAALFRPQLASSLQARDLNKPIPSTGEELPAVGLGSWITFNVGNDPIARDACARVMGAFFDSGGRLIDSSPMYGSSQKVIGYGLTKLNGPPSLFSADKVWISSGARDQDVKKIREFPFADENDMRRKILQQCRVHERTKICFPHPRKQMQGSDDVLIGSAHPLIARSKSRLILPCRGETLCLSRTHSLCSPVRESGLILCLSRGRRSISLWPLNRR